MVPFRMPAWRKALQTKIEKRQDQLVADHLRKLRIIYRKAALDFVRNLEATGRFKKPDVEKAVRKQIESFYNQLLVEAYRSVKDEQRAQRGKTTLARAPRKPISSRRRKAPRTLKDLIEMIKDREIWLETNSRISADAENSTEEFVEKFQKKYADVAPLLQTGEITPRQVKDYFLQVPGTTEAVATTRFRTASTTYFAQAQVAFYQSEPESQIIGFLFDSIRDTSRTSICRSRHGFIFKPGSPELKANTPALHYNCRSHLIALANTKRNRDMMADPSRDPANGNFVDLPNGWVPGSR